MEVQAVRRVTDAHPLYSPPPQTARTRKWYFVSAERFKTVWGDVTAPSEVQEVSPSAWYSSSQAVSVLPGAQATVTLLSVTSLTYTLGATHVIVLSQGMKNFTLLRLEVV